MVEEVEFSGSWWGYASELAYVKRLGSGYVPKDRSSMRLAFGRAVSEAYRVGTLREVGRHARNPATPTTY